MKQPRYTDLHRYPHGYVKSGSTDVAATFRRVRAEQQRAAEQAQRDAAEAQAKTVPMRRAAK